MKFLLKNFGKTKFQNFSCGHYKQNITLNKKIIQLRSIAAVNKNKIQYNLVDTLHHSRNSIAVNYIKKLPISKPR